MHVCMFKHSNNHVQLCQCAIAFDTSQAMISLIGINLHRVERDSEHAKHGFRLPFFFVLLSTEIGRINAPRNGNINALATPCRC